VSHTFDLRAHLAAERVPVEAALERALEGLEEQLPLDVGRAARHGVMSGGKRLRPILCVEAFRACGGVVGAATYDVAASLEMIHAYSLMHDDLPCMDDAELRRGRPTTHREFGEELTMRAGAALIPAAALQTMNAARRMGTGEATAARAARVVMEAAGAGGMIGGQWLDLMGEGSRLTSDALDGLHRRKTGALLSASLQLGGIVAHADEAVLAGLLDYGRAIGLAFQIADDILDKTRSVDELGKNPSDDALDKSTYVSLYGLEEAGLRARKLVAEAHLALERAGLNAPALHALAGFVIERDH
jgi:geranylgeranyl pyrophosphate synthase